VSRYQKDKTNLDFTEARESEWQWHQLGHMHVCISIQTDNHASTPPLKFFTGRMPFLPLNQQRQSTEGRICYKNSPSMKTRRLYHNPVVDVSQSDRHQSQLLLVQMVTPLMMLQTGEAWTPAKVRRSSPQAVDHGPDTHRSSPPKHTHTRLV